MFALYGYQEWRRARDDRNPFDSIHWYDTTIAEDTENHRVVPDPDYPYYATPPQNINTAFTSAALDHNPYILHTFLPRIHASTTVHTLNQHIQEFLDNTRLQPDREEYYTPMPGPLRSAHHRLPDAAMAQYLDIYNSPPLSPMTQASRSSMANHA